MNKINYQLAEFVLSAPTLANLPTDEGIEVAFVGRSNAGKSSALNALCQQKNLARTSKTPGRTQLINLFRLSEQCSLVDLPGYGYAKVPAAVKKNWQKMISEYLESRRSLKGLVMIMDIRHPLREYDQLLLAWALKAKLFVHILLNKADKLARREQTKILAEVKQQLPANDLISIQTFSALRQQGLEELQQTLNTWFSVHS